MAPVILSLFCEVTRVIDLRSDENVDSLKRRQRAEMDDKDRLGYQELLGSVV